MAAEAAHHLHTFRPAHYGGHRLTAVAFAAAASAFAVYGMVATVQHATTRNRGAGHRWRPATEKSHRALVSHATTTAVSSSAPAAGSAHLEIPRVWTKSTLAAKAP